MRGLFIAFLCALIPAVAASGDVQDSRDSQGETRLVAMLGAVDIVPTAEILARTVSDPREALIRTALQTRHSIWLRLRAISLLSFFVDMEVREVLEQLKDDPVPNIRGLALYSLGRTYGERADSRLFRSLSAGVLDAQHEVREYAVRALGWIRHPGAAPLLEQLWRTHPDRLMRRLAERSLRRRER